MAVVTDQYTANGTWTCPSGIYFAKIECWGAGGSGGVSSRGGGRGGGGSGGNYSSVISVPVVPNTTYTVTVGIGGSGNRSSWFNTTSTVIATGGVNGQSRYSGDNPAYGTGGVSTSNGCIGDIIYTGGNGGNGVDNGSGAGGGGAGSNGLGGNASSNTAGSGTANFGGAGAAGVSPAASGLTGSNYGGGGSGGANSDIQLSTRFGGIGGNGLVRITYGEADPTNIGIFSNCSSISVGCYMYSNESLTLPVNAGYYSNGTYCYTVTSGGYVSAVTNCNGCPSYGTLSYISCEFIYPYGCTGDVYYYNDGNCGYYTEYPSGCVCY
jgi:hypothetical protein